MTTMNQPSFPDKIQIVAGAKMAPVPNISENDVITLLKQATASNVVTYTENGTNTAHPVNNRIKLRYIAASDKFQVTFVNTTLLSYTPTWEYGAKLGGMSFTDGSWTFNDVQKNEYFGPYNDVQGAPALTYQNNYISGATKMFDSGANGIIKSIASASEVKQESFPEQIQVVAGQKLNGVMGIYTDDVLVLNKYSSSAGVVIYTEDGTDTPNVTGPAYNRIRLDLRAFANGDGKFTFKIPYYYGALKTYFAFNQSIRNGTGTAFTDGVYTFLDIARTTGGSKYQDFVKTGQYFAPYPPITGVTQMFGTGANDLIKSIAPKAAGPTVPPTWEGGTPSISNQIATGFDVNVQIGDDGTAYSVIVPRGDTAPTATEVKNGQSSGGGSPIDSGNVALTASTPDVISYSGLTPPAELDVYTVAENSFGLQAAPVLNQVNIEAVAPVNADGYPNISAITKTTAKVNCKINEDGNAYCVAVPNGDPVPSSAQVKAGEDSTGTAVPTGRSQTVALTAATADFMTLASLIAGVNYDVFVVAEDGLSNIQPTPVLVDLLTLTPGYGGAFNAPASTGQPDRVIDIFTTATFLEVQNNGSVNIRIAFKKANILTEGFRIIPTETKRIDLQQNQVQVWAQSEGAAEPDCVWGRG